MDDSSYLVLICDSSPDTAVVIGDAFKDDDFRFVSVDTIKAAVEALQQQRFDAVVCEMGPQTGQSLALVSELKKSPQPTPVVITATSYDSKTAIEVVKAGAFDFVAKPFEASEIRRSVLEAVECARKMGESVTIDPKNQRNEQSDAMIGNSRSMLKVYKDLGRLSPTPVTVLIRGETGTGKELVARALYQYGHRAHLPFITVNCAAIPENFLESELFGHEKGSFTGAHNMRIGKFEQANNATLFLDEIGDLDLALQAKLLRVLQERSIQRVGGTGEIPVDVRIIAATHRPLEQMIADGTFREDLFYRLNVATIELPPLRYRDGDIPLLTRFFIRRTAEEMELPPVSITANAVETLEAATWPGNVRQLQNVVRKCVLAARGYPINRKIVEEILSENDTPVAKEEGSGDWEAYLVEFSRKLIQRAAEDETEDAHQKYIEHVEPLLLAEAMKKSADNLSKAAQFLGLSRLTLRQKLKNYGLRK